MSAGEGRVKIKFSAKPTRYDFPSFTDTVENKFIKDLIIQPSSGFNELKYDKACQFDDWYDGPNGLSHATTASIHDGACFRSGLTTMVGEMPDKILAVVVELSKPNQLGDADNALYVNSYDSGGSAIKRWLGRIYVGSGGGGEATSIISIVGEHTLAGVLGAQYYRAKEDLFLAGNNSTGTASPSKLRVTLYGRD